MWILEGKSSEDSFCLFVNPEEPILVGRASNCYVKLIDKCVSRIHAKIYVDGPENKRDTADHGEVRLLCMATKHGTVVNGTLQQAGKEVVLHVGDTLRFGMTRVRLAHIPLIVCCSNLHQSHVYRIAEAVYRIGGHMLDKWDDCCTHLVTAAVRVTEKVIMALTCLKAIVTPDWLVTLLANGRLPAEKDYQPEFADQSIQGEVLLEPDPRRKKLFENRTFISLSAHNKFAGIIVRCGGKCEEFSESRFSWLATDANVYFLDDLTSPYRHNVAEVLQRAGKRLVATPEIAQAILTVSCRVYCNQFATPPPAPAKPSQLASQQNTSQRLGPPSHSASHSSTATQRGKLSLGAGLPGLVGARENSAKGGVQEQLSHKAQDWMWPAKPVELCRRETEQSSSTKSPLSSKSPSLDGDRALAMPRQAGGDNEHGTAQTLPAKESQKTPRLHPMPLSLSCAQKDLRPGDNSKPQRDSWDLARESQKVQPEGGEDWLASDSAAPTAKFSNALPSGTVGGGRENTSHSHMDDIVDDNQRETGADHRLVLNHDFGSPGSAENFLESLLDDSCDEENAPVRTTPAFVPLGSPPMATNQSRTAEQPDIWGSSGDEEKPERENDDFVEFLLGGNVSSSKENKSVSTDAAVQVSGKVDVPSTNQLPTKSHSWEISDLKGSGRNEHRQPANGKQPKSHFDDAGDCNEPGEPQKKMHRGNAEVANPSGGPVDTTGAAAGDRANSMCTKSQLNNTKSYQNQKIFRKKTYPRLAPVASIGLLQLRPHDEFV